MCLCECVFECIPSDSPLLEPHDEHVIAELAPHCGQNASSDWHPLPHDLHAASWRFFTPPFWGGGGSGNFQRGGSLPAAAAARPAQPGCFAMKASMALRSAWLGIKVLSVSSTPDIGARDDLERWSSMLDRSNVCPVCAQRCQKSEQLEQLSGVC